MENNLTPPTTRTDALLMVEALDPRPGNNATEAEKQQAFSRLQEFITVLLPE